MTDRNRINRWIAMSMSLRKFDTMEQTRNLDRHSISFRELETLAGSRIQGLREGTMHVAGPREAKVEVLLEEVGQARAIGLELVQRKERSERRLLRNMVLAKNLSKSV